MLVISRMLCKSQKASQVGLMLTQSSRSKVCAADLFSSSFKEDPMSPIAGKRYRSAILEPGGGQPESETLKNFLGRKPSSEAYYAELSRSMSHVA